jgi:hypothetical protein
MARSDIKIIPGAFNAKVGKETIDLYVDINFCCTKSKTYRQRLKSGRALRTVFQLFQLCLG